MISCTGLQPLLFAHQGALSDPQQEIRRLRRLEQRRDSVDNIICYLGQNCKGEAAFSAQSLLLLNPALKEAVSPLTLLTQTPMERLGHENQPLKRQVRRFLRRFRQPLEEGRLSADERQQAARHLKELFLVRLRGLWVFDRCMQYPENN